MEIQKNQEYIVNIIDNGFEGEGSAKIDNFTIFVPGAIQGEQVKILIVKIKQNYGYGKLLAIIKSVQERQQEDCTSYPKCGGCSLRHMQYEKTLKLKKEIVENSFFKELGYKIEIQDTMGMIQPYFYRNKLQYPVGENIKGEIELGVYAKRTHRIIPVKQCYIQDQLCQEIAHDILLFLKENHVSAYKETTLKGLIRHIVIKIGKKTKQIMVIIVVKDRKFPQEQQLVKRLTKKYPDIKTIVKNVNTQNTNVILGKENINLYGEGYIKDLLGEYQFKISPLSFYQVNPVQTEILYNKAIELANLKGNEVVFELYCGIGTISIFVAKYVKKVYGIEIIEEAIKNATENAQVNQINNVEFIAGDVEKIFPELLKKERPDIIFVDPPRKGLDTNTAKTILELQAEKVIYISCNPATLARDVKLLSEKYRIGNVQPVDMFPYTSHVETISILELK